MRIVSAATELVSDSTDLGSATNLVSRSARRWSCSKDAASTLGRMSDFLGWGAIGIVLAIPIVFWVVGIATRRRHHAGDVTAPSSAGLLGFDELFHPSAHNARIAWEAEQEIPAPAPTPDKGPGVIEAGSRIVIEVSE
jgi:hypothetical protein